MFFRARASLAATTGLILVAAEGLAYLVAGPQPVLSALVLILAPGLALTPFLPRELSGPSVRFTIVPLIGVAVSSILIITLSAIGGPLTPTSIRLLLLTLTTLSLAASLLVRRESPALTGRLSFSEAKTLLILAAALCLSVTLGRLIVGVPPVPGQDWGHYLLYVDQIRREHSMLIDNPYWMLGGFPFPDDPGAPSLYAGFALLSGEPTALLAQGIWVVAALGVLGVFTFTTTLWGPTAGLVAAGLYAAVPMNLNMLSWHGLATTYGVVILSVVLLGLGMALRGRIDRRWAAFLAIALVALAAAHRLTFMVAFVVFLLSAGIALWSRPRKAWGFLMWTTGFALLLGGGVIIDLIRRAVAIGAVNDDFRVFLSTKVDWHLVGRDLTFELGIVGAVALAVLLIAPRARCDPARYVLFGLLVTIVGFSYAWVVHFPWAYNRAPYYLPLLLSVAIGAAWTLVIPKWTLVGAAALIVAVSFEAGDLAPVYRSFYGHVNHASLTGLTYVDHLIGPHGVVVTDTCWGFLSPWLLHRPVIAAQDPELIFPKTEIGPAETARKILYGGRAGATLAKRLNARWALIDPLCTHQTGAPVRPPDIGLPVFASTRLVVLDLWAPRSAGHPS